MIRTLTACALLALAACSDGVGEAGVSRALTDLIEAQDGKCFARETFGPGDAADPEAEAPPSVRFETPCPPAFTPDLIASLQRALAARGLYDGPVTGTLDAATGAAVRAVQQPQGIDSAIPATATLRRFGLVPWDFSGG